MIDTDEYIDKARATIEGMQDLMNALIVEVKRLREKNKKQLDVLSTLDEMIRHRISHVKMMKVLEQGLDLPETWKEMIE